MRDVLLGAGLRLATLRYGRATAGQRLAQLVAPLLGLAVGAPLRRHVPRRQGGFLLLLGGVPRVGRVALEDAVDLVHDAALRVHGVLDGALEVGQLHERVVRRRGHGRGLAGLGGAGGKVERVDAVLEMKDERIGGEPPVHQRANEVEPAQVDNLLEEQRPRLAGAPRPDANRQDAVSRECFVGEVKEAKVEVLFPCQQPVTCL